MINIQLTIGIESSHKRSLRLCLLQGIGYNSIYKYVISRSVKGIFVVCAAATVIASLGVFAFYHGNKAVGEEVVLTDPSRSIHTITLTSEGFVPEELTIRKGERVVFVTDRDAPFWPASSPHPTHEIFPEFDAKKRIFPGEKWEFTFDRPGEWRYHDHINEHYTASIRIIDPTAVPEKISSALGDCAGFSGYEKQQCWDRQLRYVLETEGVAAAFDFFSELYRTEPDIPKACHEWGHALGKAAYAQYKKTGKLELVPEASYCGYGYFHSFLAEMVKDTGNFDGVLDFCRKVEEELGDELSSIAQNCVHGVGHGTTAWLLESPGNWGQFQKTADAGIAVCERIYKDSYDRENCYDGVFNELHLDLLNNNYGMNFGEYMAKNDPFWICNEQKEEHKRSCYFEFVGIFWKIFDLDFMKAITYVVNNTQGLEQRGPSVISKIAADWIQLDIVNDSQERNIEGCRSIPEFLFESCIQGLANGFIQHGDPNNLHEKAFHFCSADYLTEKERLICFRYFLGFLKWHYTADQFKNACDLLEPRYRAQGCEGVPAISP